MDENTEYMTDREYYKSCLLSNIKIIVIGLIIGVCIAGGLGILLYKTGNSSQPLNELVIGVALLSLIIAFIACSIINVFVSNIGIVDSIMDSLKDAMSHIVNGFFVGAFGAASLTPLGALLYVFSFFRVILGLIAGALCLGLMALTALIVNAIFVIQTIYFLIRYLISKNQENRAERQYVEGQENIGE